MRAARKPDPSIVTREEFDALVEAHKELISDSEACVDFVIFACSALLKSDLAKTLDLLGKELRRLKKRRRKRHDD